MHFFSIDALKIVDVLDNFCKHVIVLWICLFRFNINGWLLHNVGLLTIEQYVLFCFFLQMLLTGVDNLDDIRHLEMKVNTSDTSLGNFGQLLQNLKQLKVSNSVIPRIR